MRTSNAISFIIVVLIILMLIMLTATTARDTVRIKQAVRAVVGERTAQPSPMSLRSPRQPRNDGMNGNMEFARFAADLVIRAETVGSHDDATLVPPPGFTQVDLIHSNSGRNNAWVVWDGVQLWVVFRGTSTKKEWEQDFEMTQTPIMTRMLNKHINRVVYPKLTEAPQVNGVGGGKVHSGFLDMYMSMRDQLLASIRDARPARVCVTGHSLGGALAQLTTVDLCTRYPGLEVDTICFGCPRVGDAEYTRGLDAAHSFVMVRNTCDVVTDMPLAVQPTMKSPKSPLLYAHPEGRTVHFTDNQGTWSNNHKMEVYRNALK